MTGDLTTRALPPAAAGTRKGRLGYLDWLRGLAVLVMIEAHTADAWTRPEDKDDPLYGLLIIVGGMGAPLFLFLAGVAVSLAAAAHLRRGALPAEASRRVRARGWQIFGYAFLLRLQSFALGGFQAPLGLLKVDILNVMGPAIAAAAALWHCGRTMAGRAVVLACVAVLVALLTPPIRGASSLAWLPDPLEWYVRPTPGRTNFTLFPWAGFVFAGAVLGLGLTGAAGRWPAVKLQAVLALAGIALAGGAWWASFQPSPFANSQFWTSSPAFFGLRVGLMVLAVPVAWAWSVRPWRRPGVWSPMEVLGVGSLFVYWVHLELVYGIFGRPLRGQFPLGQLPFAFLALCALMYVLLALWNRSRPARLRFWEDARTFIAGMT